MTGFAFPEILLQINRLAQSGNYDQAHDLYAKYLPLIVLEQQPGGLAIRKEIFKQRGLIASASVRHPGKVISPALRGVLDAQIRRTFPPGIDITRPIPQEILVQLEKS
jgi:4-hydroxy-tetrahydrodipicolinate synthase